MRFVGCDNFFIAAPRLNSVARSSTVDRGGRNVQPVFGQNEAKLLNIHAGRRVTAGLRFVDAKNGKTYVDLRTLPKSVMEYCDVEPGGGKIIGVKLKKPKK